ncbi:MAG: PAS domain-containing protein [Pseudomonadota bacterium]|nr:PAS domain-containing protein [Pseudomonadota bacterium]
MPTPTSVPEIQLPFRREAEARLREGTAPKVRVATPGLEALAVLQNMATAPGGASTALKLLHELQVHQVELDLQHEQLEQSRDEMSHARVEYVERFDFAPIAYCVVGRDGKIIEGNRAAAESFGLEQSALSGRRIESLLAPQSQFACLAMLKRLCGGSARETFELQADDIGGVGRRSRMVATVAPSGRYFMMMLIESD